MKFLGDIPIGRSTIEMLRELGHDAVRAADRLSPMASDRELVELAVREERIILCFDLDFSAIVAATGQCRPSVVTFRTFRRSATEVNARLQQALNELKDDLPKGVLVTIEDARIRVRPLPVVRRPDP